MTTDADITQADREMLAASFQQCGLDQNAASIRNRETSGYEDDIRSIALRAIAAARIAATPKPKMPCGVPGGCDDPERCASEGQCHYGWSPDQDRVATVAGILERARNVFRVNDSEYQEWEINKLAREIVTGEARPAPSGDAVEAALDSFQPEWRSSGNFEAWKLDMTDAIAAADKARGYDTAPPVAPAQAEPYTIRDVPSLSHAVDALEARPAFTAEMSELLSCLALQVRWLIEPPPLSAPWRKIEGSSDRARTIEVMTERAFSSESGESDERSL